MARGVAAAADDMFAGLAWEEVGAEGSVGHAAAAGPAEHVDVARTAAAEVVEGAAGEVTAAKDAGATASTAMGGIDRPAPPGLGRPHADRARQFMPFAALRGYYDLVREQERVVEPRRALTEEEARELGERVAALTRGQMVTAVYYDGDAAVTRTGAVSQIDLIYRDLWIVRTRIPFADLLSVEVASPVPVA